MRRVHCLSPWLEPLEVLINLSHSSVGALVPWIGAHADLAMIDGRHVELTGNIGGTWSQVVENPDTGATQTLHGTGPIKPLGVTSLIGTIQLPGFIQNGKSEGTLTLNASRGTITVRIVGPAYISPGGGPSLFRYKIAAGTGRYAHATGHGTLQLTEAQLIVPLAAGSSEAEPSFVITDRFGLTFHSKP